MLSSSSMCRALSSLESWSSASMPSITGASTELLRAGFSTWPALLGAPYDHQPLTSAQGKQLVLTRLILSSHLTKDTSTKSQSPNAVIFHREYTPSTLPVAQWARTGQSPHLGARALHTRAPRSNRA